MKTFYTGKKVLITGHTGFKGTWLCEILKCFGAKVIGYALESPTDPSLFDLTEMNKGMTSYIGDIRNLSYLKEIFAKERPEIVIHMAAQPIVRESYRNPVDTYAINVMGTVNILECVRLTDSVKSVVNVTTDKVYRNNEWDKGYVETDILDGYDPYSNSKSCSELVTHSYIQSFLQEQKIAVSTCRAGNVIGGGDFAKDRIIPDCVRAALKGEKIVVRNPNSIRPYQHVLEPLFVYLMIAKEQYENPDLAGCYNVGPDDQNCVTTGELTELFCQLWNKKCAKEKYGLEWVSRSDGGPHEANFLKLNCSKLKTVLGWNPKWSMEQTLQKIVEFETLRLHTETVNQAEMLRQCMKEQIDEYMRG